VNSIGIQFTARHTRTDTNRRNADEQGDDDGDQERAALASGVLEQNGWIDSCITIEELQHVVVQWRFIGLAAAFVAISSAIARILGDFQKGASDVQEVAGSAAKTLKMPIPATEFIALIILEMTTVFGAYLLQILLGLATIIEVLRFQLIRIREVAAERARSCHASKSEQGRRYRLPCSDLEASRI